jgi:hypothetical protein
LDFPSYFDFVSLVLLVCYAFGFVGRWRFFQGVFVLIGFFKVGVLLIIVGITVQD